MKMRIIRHGRILMLLFVLYIEKIESSDWIWTKNKRVEKINYFEPAVVELFFWTFGSNRKWFFQRNWFQKGYHIMNKFSSRKILYKKQKNFRSSLNL